MTGKTLRALQGSIKKWERIVAGTGEDEGMDNCPLCQLFWLRSGICNGCPVNQKTNKKGCFGTSYTKFCRASERNNALKVMVYAKQELDFLKSLLPKKKISRGEK